MLVLVTGHYCHNSWYILGFLDKSSFVSQLIQHAKTPASTDLNHRPIGRGHLQQSHGKELPRIPGSWTTQKVVNFQSVSMSLEEQALQIWPIRYTTPKEGWWHLRRRIASTTTPNWGVWTNSLLVRPRPNLSWPASSMDLHLALGPHSDGNPMCQKPPKWPRSIQRDKEVSIFNLLNDSKNNQSIYVNST